jgi:hypothetical protein
LIIGTAQPLRGVGVAQGEAEVPVDACGHGIIFNFQPMQGAEQVAECDGTPPMTGEAVGAARIVA